MNSRTASPDFYFSHGVLGTYFREGEGVFDAFFQGVTEAVQADAQSSRGFLRLVRAIAHGCSVRG